MESAGVEGVVEALTAGVDAFGSLDLDALSAREAMTLTRAVEVVRRRLDAQTDRLSGHLHDTAKFGVDGHRSAKDAITYLGRLPSDEAHNRVLLFRRLERLPKVAAAYERGLIATEAARAIARLAANPRVAPLLDDVIDDLFVEQATTDSHQGFTAWLRDLERAADADGAGADAEHTHQRRRTAFTHNAADDSYQLRTDCGSLHGALIGEVLAAFELAELEADRAEAIATHGPDATPTQYRRTPTQRRTDAVIAIFSLAAAAPSDVVVPDPVVNVVVDAETVEDELARVAGTEPAPPSSTSAASAAASPAPPATPPTSKPPSAAEAPARASGPTAPAHPNANNATTSAAGARPATRTPATATSAAATTTASKRPATDPSAEPTAATTSSAPTEPSSPRRRDDGSRSPPAGTFAASGSWSSATSEMTWPSPLGHPETGELGQALREGQLRTVRLLRSAQP